jgi:hypothetical protein
VRWCRDHGDEAQVLLVGADALGRSEWPAELTRRHGAHARALTRALASVPVRADVVRAAIVDAPYGLVRRYLLARQSIPLVVDAMAEACARALITID